jgi:hypothetical protein
MQKFRTLICVKVALLTSMAFAVADTSRHQINSSAETQPPFIASINMAEPNRSPSRITSLDVVGIGVSVEMFRQGKVWDELQKHPTDSILPTDLSKYPNSFSERDLASDKRAADTLEYGASHFVEQWPIPAISIWSYCNDPVEPGTLPGETNYAFFNKRIDALRMPAGMHAHKIQSLGAFFSNEPEEVLERAFQFFDGNPEVPALVVMVSDGDMTRQYTGDKSREAYWNDGPRKSGAMTETFVALMLARRDRVDALRPFAGTPATALHAAGPVKPGFKPSKYLPEPWTADQISQFDHLPTIAVLQRPIRVTYMKDKDGNPTFDDAKKAKLISTNAQQIEFKKAFDAALQDIPGGHPARIFYDTNGSSTGARVVPLAQAVHNSIPDFDLFQPDQGYDITARMGNTGAASPFVQWALAAMATYQHKDSAMTVNLRQAGEVMITIVTPAGDTSTHPMGHPFNFNLAPEDGGPAVPVAPPPKSQHSSSTAPVPARSDVPRQEALGAKQSSGDICMQSGVWRCDPPDAVAGDTHALAAGRRLPLVRRQKDASSIGKMLGGDKYDLAPAVYTLISYDMPSA